MQLCRGVLDRVKSATASITSLSIAYEIILADFNLLVSTPIAKLPNFTPHQIFWLYSTLPHIVSSINLWDGVNWYRWFSWGVVSLPEGKSRGPCLVQLCAKHRLVSATSSSYH